MAKKGNIPWNKGIKVDKTLYPKMGNLKPHSKKTKEKMSLSRNDFFKRGGTVWNKGKECLKMIGNTNGFKKGQTPWNQGKKSPWLSERNKINNPCKRGNEHHSWKGGITSKNRLARNSVEYSLWRKSCFERDNFTCQFSGQSGGDIQVHHINNFADFPELRTTISNGITMTKKIHKLFHKNYGVKNNTPEQLEEFSEDLLFNPVNDWMVHA